MKNWFETLDAREQVFVLIGAVAVICALLYLLIWTPLERSNTNLQADVTNLQQALAELKPLSSSSNATRSGPQSQAGSAASGAQSPIIIVDKTLRSRGLERYRKRSQPTTSNGIRVEFEDVAFDDLVLWLGDLGEQYEMHVQAASFARGSRSSTGRVNATLTLERAL